MSDDVFGFLQFCADAHSRSYLFRLVQFHCFAISTYIVVGVVVAILMSFCGQFSFLACIAAVHNNKSI